MACIPPNPRRVGYIDPIHVPLDGPQYMGSHIHQHFPPPMCRFTRLALLCAKQLMWLYGFCNNMWIVRSCPL